MSIIPSTDRIAFAVTDLHPKMRSPIASMIEAARARPWTHRGLRCRFEPFEGYRSPVRQHHLLTVDKTTKAGPWKSAHQYGLAVDFAVRTNYGELAAGWSWPNNAPWADLKKIAKSFGLDIPIEWDRGHVQHPLWLDFKKLL